MADRKNTFAGFFAVFLSLSERRM
jgi:hypothetical protein